MLDQVKPFCLRVEGLHTFKKNGLDCVLWGGVGPCQQLLDLRQQVCRLLSPDRLEGPFIPHLTLGRVDDPKKFCMSTYRQASVPKMPEWRAEGASIMKRKPKKIQNRGEPLYDCLREYRFHTEALG